mgnify:CR=1 FL=1
MEHHRHHVGGAGRLQEIGHQLAEVPMIHEGMSQQDAWDLARQIVADVRLPDPDRILKSYPHQLSGGQQQRIVIAMALMSKPSLLILDEPTRGIDVGAKAEVHRLMGELAAQGIGVLMISSELPEILAMSDRVLVMYEGRLTANLSKQEMSSERIMAAATGQTI